MNTPQPIELGQVRTLLWLTDLSTRAAACREPVRWLAGLGAEADSATVMVVHALNPGSNEDPPAFAQRTAQARAQVAALAGDLGSVGIDAQAIVMAGPADEVAARLIQEHTVDLCVLGRTGVTGLDRLLLGSTARRLVRELHVPLFIVQEPDLLPPRTVVCPVDPTDVAGQALDASLRGVRAAAALARASRARVTFSSVALASGFVPEDRIEVGRRLERRVAEALEELPPTDHGFRVVVARTIAEGVYDAARRADLLVLGSTGRTGLARFVMGSTAEELIATCPVNTLVVH